MAEYYGTTKVNYRYANPAVFIYNAKRLRMLIDESARAQKFQEKRIQLSSLKVKVFAFAVFAVLNALLLR